MSGFRYFLRGLPVPRHVDLGKVGTHLKKAMTCLRFKQARLITLTSRHALWFNTDGIHFIIGGRGAEHKVLNFEKQQILAERR